MALRVNVVNLDTNITIYVNDDLQVLCNKDGVAYDNLYAAGGSADNSIPPSVPWPARHVSARFRCLWGKRRASWRIVFKTYPLCRCSEGILI